MYQAPQPARTLHRTADNRVLAGVCGGLAQFFGIDVTLVRVGWVLFTLVGGSGLLAYLIGWAVMPDASGRRALTPLVTILLFFIAIPALCFLVTLPFRLFFN